MCMLFLLSGNNFCIIELIMHFSVQKWLKNEKILISVLTADYE